MGFKKQTNKQNKQLKFKHVNIMAGYEFRNMTRKQVY